MRRRSNWLLASGAGVLALVAVEGLLHLQQALGPFYDLELHDIGSVPSETLNHEHSAREDWHLADPETYGSFAGWRYTVRYDRNGVRRDRFREEPADPAAPRVLLLGDSFVEGYDDANTLSAHVWKTLESAGQPARVFNAGASSCSPLIYTVQAQRLVPLLTPDLVVVVLDETDLGDDVLRYAALAVRDESGRVVAVRSSPAHRQFADGFLALKKDPPPTYLQRFVRRVRLARFSAATAAGRTALGAVDPLVFARDVEDGAAQRHAREIAAFAANVDELVRTLVGLLGDPRRVLLVSHPHREHLVAAAGGRRWNRFVAATAREAAARHGVGFFDAAPAIAAAFAADPGAAYWRGDMHFNFDGLAVYGATLGEVLGRRLAEVGAD
jgi:hypothetical protein